MKKISKIPVKKPRQIKPDELAKIRRFFHKKQNKGTCPVLGIRVDESDMVVDHSHRSNAKNLDTKDGGLIRGVIHRGANVIEGKVTNSFIRTGLHKVPGLNIPDLLENLAAYLRKPPMTHLKYIHPSEKPKDRKLKKTSVNKLRKLFVAKYPNRKVPDVLIYKKPKKGKHKGKKLTVGLERLYEEFDLEPEFLKG